jgi:hypothetical protein
MQRRAHEETSTLFIVYFVALWHSILDYYYYY